jgi:hypothetical protein
MMEEDFYATLKLKTGEEIFARVSPSEEYSSTILIVNSPIIISEVKGRTGTVGYKLEPWLKTTTEDMFIIKMEDVLTLSESSDIEMIMMYQSFTRQSSREQNKQSRLSRKMGYLSNVNDAKEILEKIFKRS